MTQNLREVSTVTNVAEPVMRTPRYAILGYVCGVFGTVLFSLKAILIKLAYQPVDGLAENSVDAITLMALRLGISSPIYIAMLVFVISRSRAKGETLPPLRDFFLATVLGMLGYYVCAWLDIQGLKYITAQLERLILFTYPVFVFVLGAMFFGKPLTRWALIAIVLAYAGIAVIFYGGDIAIGVNVPLGSFMVLACAFWFAMFQLLSKPMITRLGSVMFTCCGMLGAGVMIFLHFFVQHISAGTLDSVAALPPRIFGIGVALALFATLMPSFLVSIAIGRIGPQAVGALGMISPLAVIYLAVMWLGEPFGLMDALGTALTLIGVGLYTWFDLRVQNQPSKAAPRQR